MDSLSITAIIAGVSGLIIAVLTHIKRSSCFGVNIITTESHTPVLTNFPELATNESKTEEHTTITESRPATPNILIQPSKPIAIPTTPLITRANFL